jgi:hypothetical protein
MNFAVQSQGLLANNRLLVALYVTGCIGLFVGIVYVLAKNGGKIGAVLQSGPAIAAYRVILAGAAVVCLVLSLRPREELGLAGIYYIFLWPLIIAQIVAGLLPWGKFVQKYDSNAVAAAISIGVCAFFIDSFLLRLIGYVGYRL